MTFSPQDIHHYAQRICDGDIGIIPCDTILGLIGIGTDHTHHRLCQIKQRKITKPFLWLISGESQLETLVSPALSSFQTDYLHSVWPGPVTLILPKNPAISDGLTGQQSTIAIRYPDFVPIQWFIESVGHPILSTSINQSSHDPCTTKETIPVDIRDQVDFVWTPFLPHYQQPSQIIDLTTDQAVIIRQ
jgi:tRNA threonylcarbamoyl adenosine modification protein (Sua5/YciO/YrdC/YwlC family)